MNTETATSPDAWTPEFKRLILATALRSDWLLSQLSLDPELFGSTALRRPDSPSERIAEALTNYFAEFGKPPSPEVFGQIMSEVTVRLSPEERQAVTSEVGDVLAVEPADAFVLGRVKAQLDRRALDMAISRAKDILDRDPSDTGYADALDLIQKGTAPIAVTSATSLSEPLDTFLTDEDVPLDYIFPVLLPAGVILLLHGDPRARKSLVGFELALSAATGTAPFGLSRFQPESVPIPVWYIQEEDPRNLTRRRIRRLIRERRVTPDMEISVRRGVNLDDPGYVNQIIATCQRLGTKLLVLDAARRLSAKTDEGPAKVRELTAVLRRIVDEAGVTLIVVHHDVKPSRDGQDSRRRSQRASGGDWFAACECPVHVERLSEVESLCFPQDYKFSADPAPFTFKVEVESSMAGPLITRMIGKDSTPEQADRAGARGKLLAWLRDNPNASKSQMKAAGIGWNTLSPILDGLMTEGLVDSVQGRQKGSWLYFVREDESSSASQDGSR